MLKDLPKITCRPGLSLPAVDLSSVKKNMKHSTVCDVDVLSAALYPEGTDYFFRFQDCFGPVEKLNTRIFFVGPKMGEEFEVSCLLTILKLYIILKYIHQHNKIIYVCVCLHKIV